MSGIIEDLLLLARAESKSVAMQWAEIDTAHFIDTIRDAVLPVFEKRNVVLVLPSAPTPAKFRASANYLSLAVKNLLLNAAKHSAAGSTVTLELTQVEQDVIFKVVDQGEGIPAESLPYVFDPFYRADTARNRASGGAGVGLSLTKAMVSLHSGTIDVTSTFGQGATFTIHLPVQQA